MELLNLVVDSGKSIIEAMRVIDKSGKGTCFIVRDDNKLMGVLTDGDIRRKIIEGINLESDVDSILNDDFVSLNIKSSNKQILKTLDGNIKIIPLVDDIGVLVDYASIDRIKKIPVAKPSLGEKELEYVIDCIESSWISSSGKYIDKFQDQFTTYSDGYYAVSVSNGTVALHLALLSLGIKKGDEVIVPNLTFAATINAVIYTGATPVIADVSTDNLNIDPSSIKRLINKNTKAIIPVHLYGYPCDMDEIMKISLKHNLFVIEDCAEALGSLYNRKPVGTFGHASTFSFFGNKTITTGEGGMVLFRDKLVADKAIIFKNHGMSKSKRYWHDVIGYNFRMTNLQAAIGVAQMEQLNKFISRKREIASMYNYILKDFDFLTLPSDSVKFFNSYWLYTIIVDNAIDINKLIDELKLNSIDVRPVFFGLSSMDIYKEYTVEQIEYNNIRGISLPSSPILSDSEVQYIGNKFIKILSKGVK